LSIPPALRNLLRRDRLRLIVITILGFLTLAWLFGRIGGGSNTSVLPAIPPIGSGPPVVIVTTIDPKADPIWVSNIKKNRDDYAKRHGA
jgi:mannan polymerase II complex MNN11 subunit